MTTLVGLDLVSKYILTNAYNGPTKPLVSSSSNDSATIDQYNSTFATDTKRQWYLSTGEYVGFYHLHTVAQGDGKSLDVFNDKGVNSTGLTFAASGFFSGQLWRFDQWTDGKYRLSNNFTGVDMHLDVFSDTLGLHLASGEASGQHWSFNQYIVSSSSSSTFSASSTSSSANNQPTGPASLLLVSSNKTLSGGAIAGIVVGAIAGIFLFIEAIVLGIYIQKRRSKKANNDPTINQFAPKFIVINQGPVYPFHPTEMPAESIVRYPVELATP
jgi:hypothetical protein